MDCGGFMIVEFLRRLEYNQLRAYSSGQTARRASWVLA